MYSFVYGAPCNRRKLMSSFRALSVEATTVGILGVTTVFVASTNGISWEAASSKTQVTNRNTTGRVSQKACDAQRSGTNDKMYTVVERISSKSLDAPEIRETI